MPMKYLARKRCTRLSLIAIFDKSHSGWSGAPHPRLGRFTPGVSPLTVKDGGWAPTRPVSRPSRQPATGPPGSYPDRTSTGRRRRAYEHQDPPWPYVTVSPPALLGARENLTEGWRGALS